MALIPSILALIGFVAGGLFKPVLEANGKAVLGRRLAEVLDDKDFLNEVASSNSDKS